MQKKMLCSLTAIYASELLFWLIENATGKCTHLIIIVINVINIGI